MVHGWYSEKQKSVTEDKKGNNTYLYYKDMKDNIVEVTMVSNTKEHKSNYDDIIYLGEMKAFYKSSKIILN